MTSVTYEERPTPLAIRKAVRWNPSTYRAEEGFPEIEYVPEAIGVPMHGLLHTLEGDIVINPGDYITAHPGVEGVYPTYGFYGAYPWWEFESYFEPH